MRPRVTQSPLVANDLWAEEGIRRETGTRSHLDMLEPGVYGDESMRDRSLTWALQEWIDMGASTD